VAETVVVPTCPAPTTPVTDIFALAVIETDPVLPDAPSTAESPLQTPLPQEEAELFHPLYTTTTSVIRRYAIRIMAFEASAVGN
jgi:hypothetical protein